MRNHDHVPLRPPPERADPDPRLDPYRERAGVLFQDGNEFGVVYLRVETFRWQTGGHLWWRSWSKPGEQIQGFIEFTNGRFDDFVEDADTLAEEIGDWQRGRFPYRGEVLRVSWLDDEESRRVRTAVFGLDEYRQDD